VLIINVVSCPPGTLIWKIKYLVSCIHRKILYFNGTTSRVHQAIIYNVQLGPYIICTSKQLELIHYPKICWASDFFYKWLKYLNFYISFDISKNIFSRGALNRGISTCIKCLTLTIQFLITLIVLLFFSSIILTPSFC
jgi:hypothetical protein